MIWFASDMHFGHAGVIKYCNRPWSCVEEMDEGLVKNWNDVVSKDDIVYHLGDWAYHNYHHIARLKGRIFSIPGNHDRERMKKLLPVLPNGFTEEIHYLKVDKERRFALCHYPIESWRREYRFHLHGHSHGDSRPVKNRLDVGVDATRLYRPISIDEVLTRIELNNQELPKCMSCNDSGDIHTRDGQWVGICNCEAGKRLRSGLTQNIKNFLK